MRGHAVLSGGGAARGGWLRTSAKSWQTVARRAAPSLGSAASASSYAATSHGGAPSAGGSGNGTPRLHPSESRTCAPVA